MGFKRIVILGAAAGAAVLGFKLFEPVFVGNTGWKDLPELTYPQLTSTAPGWDAFAISADEWLSDTRIKLNAPALSAVVSVGGEIVWAGAAGYADIDNKIEATPQTIFRIGSTSKAVTSVAMGVLIDDGAVDLDAPLSSYMPDLSAPMASVTTRQAMSHTAGVRNYGMCFCFPAWEYFNRKHYDGAQRETLQPFEASPLLFESGENFAYTSLGYNAAGGVIEAAAKKPFAEFLKDEVFTPLGMTHTRTATGGPIDGAATFYDVEGARYKKTFRVDNTNKLPSGGILSTPSDLARLGVGMIEASLFAQETRNLLIRPQPLANGEENPQGYALGWRFDMEAEVLDGEMVASRFHHNGTAQGSTSYYVVYPEYGVVVSVMMNKSQTSLKELGGEANTLTNLVFRSVATEQGAQ